VAQAVTNLHSDKIVLPLLSLIIIPRPAVFEVLSHPASTLAFTKPSDGAVHEVIPRGPAVDIGAEVSIEV
jgi:hypothetical protein